MPLYQDLIMKQIRNVGQDRVTKQETVLTPPEPQIDFGSLMMMLMMMGLFKNPQGGGGFNAAASAPFLAAPGINPSPPGSMMPPMPPYSPPQDPLAQMLMSALSTPTLPGMPF